MATTANTKNFFIVSIIFVNTSDTYQLQRINLESSKSCLQSQAEEGADAPFGVVHSEIILIADVGEVIYRRQTDEFVAPLIDNGSATGDDDLWELVVQGHTVVVHRHRRVAIYDERG